jgi:dTDP-4-dehydrorhamnose 3,5-epimerase
VHYQISQAYVPEAARWARWDDAAFGIPWHGEVVVINERDRSYPDFRLEPARQA